MQQRYASVAKSWLCLALQRSAMSVAKRCRFLPLQRRTKERIASAIEIPQVTTPLI